MATAGRVYTMGSLDCQAGHPNSGQWKWYLIQKLYYDYVKQFIREKSIFAWICMIIEMQK